KSVIALLEKYGYPYCVSCGDYEHNNDTAFCSPEECFSNARLVLTLGGDGTLLRVATLANQYDVPLLGVNLGHVGFLAELEPAEIGTLADLLSNGFDCTERMMLQISILRNDQAISKTIALNDAVIRGINGKPVHIMISDSNTDLLDYFCDGFIVATPTGSTAYSMSAGGPIIEPRSSAIVVTPICAHTMGARSVVFGDAQQEIFVRVTNPNIVQTALECDGTRIAELQDGDVVHIRRHQTPVHLVKLHNKSFYKVLNEKIGRRMS
ncbi:MAG: NAD(+)/NADH kinase, partial [Clostridia bacterium]|nr:NAD(+)/NADH kinase [Clostridia bacterium]